MYSKQSTGIALQIIDDAMREDTLVLWQQESNLSVEELNLLYTYFFVGANAVFKQWIESDFAMPEEKVMELIDNVVKYGLYNYIYIK